jgi:hypothetical protein
MAEPNIEELSLNDTNSTFALVVPSIFLSSFPGFIAFGEVSQYIYKSGKVFKFDIFIIYKLYLTIVKILTFFTDQSVSSIGPQLFHSYDEKNENYFWSGHVIISGEERKKIIKIGIETNDNIIFEIIFQIEQFQNLFYCLQKSILNCLCLKESENLFIELFLEENIETIKRLKSDPNFTIAFIKSAKEKLGIFISVRHLKNLFTYYFEVIIILHKLKSLQINPYQRESIINQII